MPAAIFFFHSKNHSQHVEHFAAVIKGLLKISSVLRKEAGSVPMMAMAARTALGSASYAEQKLKEWYIVVYLGWLA
jgi:hypothetical protein